MSSVVEQLVRQLTTTPTPRPEALARGVAKRLFEFDGELLEVRVPADSKGRFPRPDHMLVHRGNPYVALLGRNFIKPQRVLRRTPVSATTT